MKKLVCMLMFAGLMCSPLLAQSRGAAPAGSTQTAATAITDAEVDAAITLVKEGIVDLQLALPQPEFLKKSLLALKNLDITDKEAVRKVVTEARAEIINKAIELNAAPPVPSKSESGHSLAMHENNVQGVITLEDGTTYTLNRDDNGNYKEEDLAKLPKWARDQLETYWKSVQHSIRKVEAK